MAETSYRLNARGNALLLFVVVDWQIFLFERFAQSLSDLLFPFAEPIDEFFIEHNGLLRC